MKNHYVLKVSLLLSFLFAINNLFGANINVSGTIASNTTWSADTVKVTADLTIANSVILTINPGVYVQFQGHYKLDVKGRIIALGTASNKITFTALSPTVGWSGIRFENTPILNDTSKFEYCVISYGKANSGLSNDKSGGAVFLYNFSKVVIENCILSNNYAAYYGGAIACRYNASPRIINNLMVNNTASSVGGAMMIYSSSNPILINNTIAYNTSSTGGGIYFGNSNGLVKNCIIYGNTASSQGYNQIYGVAQNISNCNIEGGYSYGTNIIDTIPGFVAPSTGVGSSYDGLSADYSLSSNSPLIDIGDNSVLNIGGPNFDIAGNFRYDNNRVDIGAYEYISSTEVCGTISTNTTWSGNILMNCDVTISNGVTLTIQPGAQITSTGPYKLNVQGRLLAQGTDDNYIKFTAWNHNEGWKGIMFQSVATSNDTSKIEYCKLSYKNDISSTYPNYYGAIFIYSSSKVLVRNNIISNNSARYGGGITLYYSSAKIVGNLIANNQSYYYGGGLYITGSSADSPQLINNTITGNETTNYSFGGGIYASSSVSSVFKNNIIYTNFDNAGNHLNVDNVYPNTGLNITYSCVEGGYTGTGNISSAPLFKNAPVLAGIGVNLDNFNLSLQATSPCIDGGSSASTGLSLPANDLSGKTRIYSASIDMGAYEDKSALSICGTISSDQVWDANVININCNVTINNGATVTIVPGTKVLFNGFYNIYVLGAIQAEGTEGDTILFTAANTSTGWDGIQIYNPSTSNDSCLFSYCRFEYAKRVPSNYQLSGGAISVRSVQKIRVTNNRFINNQATGSYGYGGAMSIMYSYNYNTIKKFNHNIFENNLGNVGIININYSDIDFANNVLYNNTSTSGPTLRLSYTGGTYINNLISNNSGSYGGAYISGEYSDYTVKFFNNIIVNNQASYGGGGMYVGDSKPLIYNNTIANNYAGSTLKGGGIYFTNNGDANLKSNIIYGNTSLGGAPNQIYINDVTSDPKMYNNDIEGGILAFAGTGAGINYSGVFSENTNISPNFNTPSAGSGTSFNGKTADWSLAQGSALINSGYSNSSSLPIPSLDYSGNSRIFNGRIDIGAIENQEAITAPCTIAANTQWEADTIHISCDVTIDPSYTLTIKPGTTVLFDGFYSINVDGTINATGTPNDRIDFLINDTTGFWDSTSTAGGWNGINFNSNLITNDSSKFYYCTFSFAKAAGTSYQEKMGAAMYIYNSPKIVIENSIFANNFASDRAGALYLESSNIIFRNNIVANNQAVNYGGGLFIDDCELNFNNNSVVNNKSKYYCGAYINSSIVNIKNSLFWGNQSWLYPTGNYSQLLFQSSSQSEIYNSDIEYGLAKIGNGYQLTTYSNNLNIDPLFLNPSAGKGYKSNGLTADWGLSTSSPLLNNGYVGSSHTALDFNGNARIVADTIDIGAFEVQMSPQFIDIQPESKLVCIGSSTSFAVHAIVNANYHWQKNGANIAGATSNIYTISNMALTDTAFYNCIVSNAFGSVSSDTVQLEAKVLPTITSSPSATASCLGSSITFNASAQGTTPLTYQWYNTNGQLQSGTSSQSYDIGTGVLNNTPNGYPSPFSNYYWGAKHQFLILASELTAAGITAGDFNSIGFDVAALNSSPTLSNFEIKMGLSSVNALTSSWISGLTSVYSVGSYQSTVGWNNFGFQTAFAWDGTSNIVMEVCSNNSSWITSGNASVNQSATSFNSSHEVHADAAGVCSYSTSGILYQQRPNIRIVAGSNANTSSYSINSITANDASNYYMIATNSCGSIQSTGAILSINYEPNLTPISASDVICEDNSYAYSTTTSQGTSPITYQWFKDGTAISSANSLSYNITAGDTSDAGIYYCKASNLCGSDSTNQSVLAVNEKPQITSQSSSQSVCENQSITLNVTASGTNPITYQWFSGGSPISGATNNTYTISSVSISDAATYYCKVSNACTSTPVVSSGIVITVKTSPSVTSQTASVSVCSGSAAPFSITTTGTSPITYQWYSPSGSISSATNNTYTISSASTSNAGNYYCVSTNSCGSFTSNVIPLTVNSAPSITSQPSALTKCENQSALFSVQASGTATLAFQWYKGGVSISGANSSSYLISPVSTADAANYYCVVTNSCGNATSNTVALTVKSNVSISAQSSSQTLCAGSSPTLSVTTSGTAPITYQWYNSSGAIGSATNSTYSLASIDTTEAGNYYCIATNSCASATSNSITLTVNEAPSIVTNPASATVCQNLSAVFTVSTEGTSPMTYQWYNGSGAISGATASSYIIPQVSTSHAGSYYVKATNSCGVATSTSASLTVNNSVSITAQSSSQTVCSGSSPSFSITAAGTAPITYQWYKGNTAISGATNNAFSLTSVDTSNASTYYVIATNSCNSIQSNQIILTVNESPSINSQPSNSTVCVGSSAQLSVSATGTAPLTYQWYKGSTLISGATNSLYLISQAATTDASTYYVKVTNSCGNVSSSSASITVNSPVSITTQSGNTTKCTSNSVTFSVTATGTGPLTYQWYKGASAISGASSASYSIASVATTNAGDYYCIISNSCNSVQTNSMALTVNTPPSISSLSNSATKCNGENISLVVNAGGTSPLSYQWYEGSTAISGAVSNVYAMYSLGSSDAGTYHCVITNSCGTTTSSSIVLTVNIAPTISSQSSNTAICATSSASLSVTAAGTAPITYQWYNSSGSISGATNNQYSINNADTSDADNYYCIITNSSGTTQTQNIALTVNQAPSILSQSTSANKCVGESFSFNVSADGSNPLIYQWYNSQGSILGANSSLYLINSLDTSNASTYYCIVSNLCGSVQSTNKVLTVNQAPSFVSQSSSLTRCEGTSALFTVSSIGSSPLVYQWYTDTGMVAGANANSYSISSVSVANAGNYYVEVSNNCGNISSSTKVLTINTAPVVISQSSDDTLCESMNAVLQVGVSGTNPISYQWYKSSSSISGAINSYYTISSIDTNDAGSYHAIATNLCGNAQTSNISLTVNQLAAIIFQSGDSSRCEGESMTFEVSAHGTNPLQYQWYKGTTAISNAQSNQYYLNNVLLSDAGYYKVVVSNMCNSLSSNYKLLSTHANPVINLGNDTGFCSGGSVTLTPGFGYQCVWSNGSFNNQINVTSTGSYFVNATNQYGCQGSSDTININVALPFANQSLCVVGVDTATNKNILVWEKTPNTGIQSFNLYKESSVSNVWTLIGNVDYDSLSVFIDLTSTPHVKPERYAMTIVDSCNNESMKSLAHRTMHLTVNAGQTANKWNLLWNSYEGFIPSTYRVYRADSTMNYIKIDSMAASSSYTYLWTDTAAPSGLVYYMVEIVHPNGGCSPTKANTNYNSSRSNTANNGIVPNTALVPDFIASQTHGMAPMIVQFYDQTSNGTVDSWFWNFGDGDNAVVQNPVHQYDSAGVYHVSLTVTNSNGTQSIIKTNFIDVLPNGIYTIRDDFDVNVFPNPYQGATNISYTLNNMADVSIEVYSSLGKLVTVLVNENQNAGTYQYQFNAKKYGFSPGVYYLRMRINEDAITKRLIEVK